MKMTRGFTNKDHSQKGHNEFFPFLINVMIQSQLFSNNVYCFKLFSQGSDVAHGPLVYLTVDVTPPILTFKRKPLRSLSKASITWITNEEASGVCEVVGPSFYRSVVCDKAWSEDYLPEGDFTLNVTVYDESLNMAGPFQHNWHNSKCNSPFP